MTQDPRLERYLTSLEQVLKPFPVSDRADIVTEIKSHILSAMERDPEARLDSVLAALGEPETVANRYLIERGLKLTKPPISPVVKWLVIGFLGTLAMILFFAGFVVSRFAPMVQIDDKNEKISLFGGRIEVNGKEGSIHITGSDNAEFSGTKTLADGQKVLVKFAQGKFELSNSEDGELSWDCKIPKDVTPPAGPTIEKDVVTLDLNQLAGVKCELTVPKGADLSLDGQNGKIEVNEPQYNLKVELNNGKVELSPDEAQAYRYSLSVENGKKDAFASSEKAGAYAMTVHLNNGKITHLE